MLFKRYGDPLSVLATFSLSRTMDFLLYLLDLETEETLWDMWLMRQVEKKFKDFKKESGVKFLRTKYEKSLSEEAAKQNVEYASQFITIRKEETDGGSI